MSEKPGETKIETHRKTATLEKINAIVAIAALIIAILAFLFGDEILCRLFGKIELEETPSPQPSVEAITTDQPQFVVPSTQTPTNHAPEPASPTNTWTPTTMPTPTFMLSPTPGLALPFSDSFDQGLDPAWFQPIPGGDWFTSNGRLTLSGSSGRQDSYIYVGNSAWTNYDIELDFWLDRYTGAIGVIVRSDPPGQMGLRFVVNGYDVMWQSWQNGIWQTIDTVRRHNYAREGRLTVEVHNSGLTGRVDGLTELAINYPGTPSQGVIGLTSDCNNTTNCSEFDNFTVEEINP